MSIFGFGDGGAAAALELLRSNPLTAVNSYGFHVVTANANVYNANTGGTCSVSCQKADNSVYKLVVSANAGLDYFYPYRNSVTGGVGECTVPLGQKDGTLVLTGGMNGCSLQVNKWKGAFVFYHDLNGQYLDDTKCPGDIVCRVDYKSYAGPLAIGSKGAEDLSVSTKTPTMFSHTLLTVHEKGKWCVYVSGIYLVGQANFRTFVPTVSPLITSFEDD
ncbi:MAG: hypothetical protein ABI779_19500 [Acidobacteriota bacterium]